MLSRVISFLVLIFALFGNAKAVKYISLGNHFVAESSNSEEFSQEVKLELAVKNSSLGNCSEPESKHLVGETQNNHSNYSKDRLTFYFSSRLKS